MVARGATDGVTWLMNMVGGGDSESEEVVVMMEELRVEWERRVGEGN